MESLIKLMQEKLGDEVITKSLVEDLRQNFDVAVNEAVNAKLETAKTELEDKNTEEMVVFKESLIDSLDSYVEYAADEYLKENKVALESTTKVEAAESLITTLKEAFKVVGLEIPATEVDHVKDLEEKADEVQEKLNVSIETKLQDNTLIEALEQKIAFMERCKSLTESKVSQVEDLMEGLEFKDMDDFDKKLEIVIGKITDKKITEQDEDFENLDDGDLVESSIDKYLE